MVKLSNDPTYMSLLLPSRSWKVSTVDPADRWKLKTKVGGREGVTSAPTTFKCPMTGMTAVLPAFSNHGASSADRPVGGIPKEIGAAPSSQGGGCPYDHMTGLKKKTGCPVTAAAATSSVVTPATHEDDWSDSMTESAEPLVTLLRPEVGLSATTTKMLFPFHVILGRDFTVKQVGKDIPRVLQLSEDDLVGKHIGDSLKVTLPMGASWSWDWLRKLEDQSFTVKPVRDTEEDEDDEDAVKLIFKASAVLISDHPIEAMLIMTPDANNLSELRHMKLTLSDLPVHGAHRDAVFLREHLSTQMNNALKMEKLSRSLKKEKELLESLLPEHAAEGLRNGLGVEPMMHQNTTLFFSDIVGFTNICKQIYPWEVIEILNKLYCIMDHLALKFKLFKIETIGDAYVCCSGLPAEDPNHASNVAMFAIAVTHCCKHVRSPIDGASIELRIGLNSGACASGVVGVTNPRYCVFGDTVNMAARHESSGEAGKVHCSATTRAELKKKASDKFVVLENALVHMKGKGLQQTYWLYPSENNEILNAEGLVQLDKEVRTLLAKTDFTCLETKKRNMDLLNRSFNTLDPVESEDLRAKATLYEETSNCMYFT
jgi:class 3 adenylate cyclase